MSEITLLHIPVSDLKAVVQEWSKHSDMALKMMTATDELATGDGFKIWYVFGNVHTHAWLVGYITLAQTVHFPSIGLMCHAAWNYEKKIHTFFGLIPDGHPDLRPLILHENWPSDLFPLRKDMDWQTRPQLAQGTYLFQEIDGEGVYEIPVGPIHAGIIEPGHFRFSAAGEQVVHLEPRLGYTHKGSEKLFEILSVDDQVRLSEKISGDSSFSHSLAYCQALECLAEVVVPERARYLRVIYAELERIANHLGDIGAIMVDTGFNFGGAHGARLRERIMTLNAHLTGSRFLRGVNCPGGVTRDITAEDCLYLKNTLHDLKADFTEVITASQRSPSLLNRLMDTGVLPRRIADDRGVLGITAKAVGIAQDARIDFPYAAYEALQFTQVIVEETGDVYARYRVRVRECFASLHLILQAVDTLPIGPVRQILDSHSFKPHALALGCVEGWRGEIIYLIRTDAQGRIIRVAPRDPSFVNWSALKSAALDNIVPDFPLINKSFNLSYSGNDL